MLKEKYQNIVAYNNYAKSVIRKTLGITTRVKITEELLNKYTDGKWEDTKLAEYFGRIVILQNIIQYLDTEKSEKKIAKQLAWEYDIEDFIDLFDVLIQVAIWYYKSYDYGTRLVEGKLQALLWLLSGCIYSEKVDIVFKVSLEGFKDSFKLQCKKYL